MGDVEVVHRAQRRLAAELKEADTYAIPLAHPKRRGFFRHFATPRRDWVYQKIMAPANRTLIKMMGRGVMIDQKVLSELEVELPKEIREKRNELRHIGSGTIDQWCKYKESVDPNKGTDKAWEFDLEKKDQLRAILFGDPTYETLPKMLDLPVQRITKQGRKLYGEEAHRWHAKIHATLIAARRPGERIIDIDGPEVRKELRKYASVDKFTLNKLAVDFPDVRPLQEYRKVHKLYGTYVRPLRNFKSAIDKRPRTERPHLCPDGCIHAQFMLTGTRGGRLSCRDPNLQQLPKEGTVKQMYISRFGRAGCLYGSDFSQIELRLLAAASGDPAMVEAYHNGIDLHTLTTSRIFKTPYEHFSKDYMKRLEQQKRGDEAKELSLKRDIGKTVNFLTGYGGGALGLQTVLANKKIYRPVEECEEIIDLFFDSYPAVRDLLAFYKDFIAANQCAVSLFGRVRQFEEVTSEDSQIRSKALRAGCNHLIQSTASDMLLICLSVIEDLMRDEGLDSRLILTVHDSLVIDALLDELDAIHSIVMDVLNNMPEVFKAVLGDDYDTSWMIVPFAGDSQVGYNYHHMKAVGEGKVDWKTVLGDRSK
jgi:DNA polymerase I-like protein with 3'-5' exonuclease and polymerase domains